MEQEESVKLIKSVLYRIKTVTPFPFSPYDLRAFFIFIYKHPALKPFLDGSLRRKYSYPRVQFKVLSGIPCVVGVEEGVEPVHKALHHLREFRIKGKVIPVKRREVREFSMEFTPQGTLLHYRFLTPWMGLNEQYFSQYKYLYGRERQKFLARMLAKNILFLFKDFGYNVNSRLVCRLILHSLNPKIYPDLPVGVFYGAFETNFPIPNFIGLGNWVTKGYGTIRLATDKTPINTESHESTESPEQQEPKDILNEPSTSEISEPEG
jgi:hypothetical protein